MFASMNPIFSQFWCKWLQTFDSFGVNGFKLISISASMAPNCSLFLRQWLRHSKYGAIDAKMLKSFERCQNCEYIGAVDKKIVTSSDQMTQK